MQRDHIADVSQIAYARAYVAVSVRSIRWWKRWRRSCRNCQKRRRNCKAAKLWIGPSVHWSTSFMRKTTTTQRTRQAMLLCFTLLQGPIRGISGRAIFCQLRRGATGHPRVGGKHEQHSPNHCGLGWGHAEFEATGPLSSFSSAPQPFLLLLFMLQIAALTAEKTEIDATRNKVIKESASLHAHHAALREKAQSEQESQVSCLKVARPAFPTSLP